MIRCGRSSHGSSHRSDLHSFERRGDRVVDTETASSWTVTGEAADGELAGTALERLLHHDTFAFAWFAFKPDATVYAE